MLTSNVLVSCIMPTFNRRTFVPRAIDCFLAQDYEPKELIVLDDGSDAVGDLMPDDARVRYERLPRRRALGEKRNLACERARGAVIVHWDDDDWSAPFRVRYQLEELLHATADLSGGRRLLYWDAAGARAYWYAYPGGRAFLLGNTLCYTRAHWQRTRFRALQVGEDAAFVAASAGARMITNARDDFMIASLHAKNVSTKRPRGSAWRACPAAEVHRRLGAAAAPVAARAGARDILARGCAREPILIAPACARERNIDAPAPPSELPWVSCIMPTYNRRALLPLAIRYFQRQTYDHRELIIVDDGRSVRDLIPRDPRIRYLRLAARAPLGTKRNVAVQHARGEIVMHWDDDDWHGPTRIAQQVAPIVAGTADATGLRMPHILSLDGPTLWSTHAEGHARLHPGNLWPATLAYRRWFWGRARYPAVQCGEDVGFLRRIERAHCRIACLDDEGLVVAVRHGANIWNNARSFRVEDSGRTSISLEQVLGSDAAAYRALASAGGDPGRGAPLPAPAPSRARPPRLRPAREADAIRVVLFACERDWVGSRGLPGAFAAVGAVVQAVAPAGSALLEVAALSGARAFAAATRGGGTRAASALAAERTLLAACASERPTLVLPCDDRAARVMTRLWTTGRSGLLQIEARVRGTLRRSLGGGPYLPRVTRAGFTQIAGPAGVPVPAQRVAHSLADACSALAQLGPDLVLKRDDGSAAGQGVRVVRGADELRAGWFELFPRQCGSAILQAFVAGTPALATFAAHEGKLLAAVTAEKTETCGALGPARVLTLVDDARMVEAARRWSHAVGYTGIGSLDFIRSPEHGPIAIEFNPRPTPVTAMSGDTGVDLCGALLCALAGRAAPQVILPSRAASFVVA